MAAAEGVVHAAVAKVVAKVVAISAVIVVIVVAAAAVERAAFHAELLVAAALLAVVPTSTPQTRARSLPSANKEVAQSSSSNRPDTHGSGCICSVATSTPESVSD